MTVRATDNFNRADADPIGGNWTGFAGNGAIVGNQLRQSTAGGIDAYIIWNADTPPADHYSKIGFVASVNNGTDVEDGGPCARLTTGGNGYLFNPVNAVPAAGQYTWTIWSLDR